MTYLKIKYDLIHFQMPVVNVPIISSLFNAIEVQRIITRDGFAYFPMAND
jgi:hypothetical protein